MSIPTLLRSAEHTVLKTIELNGSILDLGGDARSDYRSLIKGEHTFTTVNLDEKAVPDISHDLEQPLPIESHSYDHVLLINVLEHVYAYRQLLSEAVRVVRSGGSVLIVVPFLYPVHPSPNDYWRFSAQALSAECKAVGLTSKIVPLGDGAWSAAYMLVDRLMPSPLRLLGYVTLRPLAVLTDRVFSGVARMLGKQYGPADYPLGYVVHATV